MGLTNTLRSLLNRTIRDLRPIVIEALGQHLEALYRLSKPLDEAALEEEETRLRLLLEAWLEEQARAGEPDPKAAALEQVAATWLHRLVVLRQIEALGLRKTHLVTKAWGSAAFRDLSESIEELREGDEAEGMGLLLELLMDEVALELPDLFGPVGLTPLIPLPGGALKIMLERLNDPALDDAWTDDMTLGWVYQYWNDPAREALDAKINDGAKIAVGELASKTQLFTDRYMAEWMVQNTLGAAWLALCHKHHWTPDVLRDGTLALLDRRRADWRQQRDAGTLSPDERLPLHTEQERRWGWYVPRDLPPALLDAAPDSLRDLRILDPACGSGHFLVLLLDHLVFFYHEEARHRGVDWTLAQIVRWITQDNLYGFDLDPCAVEVATAALWLKAQRLCPGVPIDAFHLLPVDLAFARLPKDDPALDELSDRVAAEGVDRNLLVRLLDDLRTAAQSGAGSLFRPQQAIRNALHALGAGGPQADLLLPAHAEQTLLHTLASLAEDLPLHLDFNLLRRVQALQRSVAFIEHAQDASFHLVLGPPPYLTTARMKDAAWVQKHYPEGKADLFAAFLLRSAELTAPGGLTALLTMRGWMFIKQYAALRHKLLEQNALHLLADLDRGAFEEVPDEVVATAIAVFLSGEDKSTDAIVLQPTPLTNTDRDSQRTARKIAALEAQVGRHTFSPQALHVIDGHPLIYWWTPEFLKRYGEAEKLGEVSPASLGISTPNNPRFNRMAYEVSPGEYVFDSEKKERRWLHSEWAPLISGAAGEKWCAPLRQVVRWKQNAFELRLAPGSVMRNPRLFFKRGIAFTPMGANFYARAHRFNSIMDAVGRSLFPESIGETLVSMNSAVSRSIMESLNPTVTFTAGDVNRLPNWPIPDSQRIYDHLDTAFTQHEQARESSIEFREPGPSPWEWAQAWAQRMVDRAEGEPWEAFEPTTTPPSPAAHLSYAIGVALGRWGEDGSGIQPTPPPSSLPHGILFVSSYAEGHADSLDHPACAPLHAAWTTHGADLGAPKEELRSWLQRRFFKEHHRTAFDNRPIFWPLSSSKGSFVAWVSIHRMDRHTLPTLLTDHLHPTLQALQGELDDTEQRQRGAAGKERAALDKRMTQLHKLREELDAFLQAVDACAHQGRPSPTSRPPHATPTPSMTPSSTTA